MELKLDRSKTYGLALEGGGAKGAYQIGAWKALREAGIRFSAVSGSEAADWLRVQSDGALESALLFVAHFYRASALPAARPASLHAGLPIRQRRRPWRKYAI